MDVADEKGIRFQREKQVAPIDRHFLRLVVCADEEGTRRGGGCALQPVGLGGIQRAGTFVVRAFAGGILVKRIEEEQIGRSQVDLADDASCDGRVCQLRRIGREKRRAMVVVAGRDGDGDAGVGEALQARNGFRVVGRESAPQGNVAEHDGAGGPRPHRENLVDDLVQKRVLVGRLAGHVGAADVDVAQEHGQVAVDIVLAERRRSGDRRHAREKSSTCEVHSISFLKGRNVAKL